MVQEDRECQEILQQMMAIRSAVHQASLLLARAHLACVFQEAGQDPAEITGSLDGNPGHARLSARPASIWEEPRYGLFQAVRGEKSEIGGDARARSSFVT